MAQMKKTPKHLQALVNQAAAYAEHITEMIRVKTTVPLENQADHVRERTVEQMIGRAEGFNSAVESVLMEYGCYAGFHNVAATKVKIEGTDQAWYPPIGPDHPEYADWRRRYYTR